MIKDYNDFTDEELVEISVSGDSDAKEYLIRKYMSEVRSKARLYFIMGLPDSLQNGDGV